MCGELIHGRLIHPQPSIRSYSWHLCTYKSYSGHIYNRDSVLLSMYQRKVNICFVTARGDYMCHKCIPLTLNTIQGLYPKLD